MSCHSLNRTAQRNHHQLLAGLEVGVKRGQPITWFPCCHIFCSLASWRMTINPWARAGIPRRPTIRTIRYDPRLRIRVFRVAADHRLSRFTLFPDFQPRHPPPSTFHPLRPSPAVRPPNSAFHPECPQNREEHGKTHKHTSFCATQAGPFLFASALWKQVAA